MEATPLNPAFVGKNIIKIEQELKTLHLTKYFLHVSVLTK
jgi:hypothetical protein